MVHKTKKAKDKMVEEYVKTLSPVKKKTVEESRKSLKKQIDLL